MGRDGAGRGVDEEGALDAAAGLLGRGVGAVGFTIVGFAATGLATTAGLETTAGLATTAGFAGVIGLATVGGFAAAAGFVAGLGLPTSSGADALLTTWGLGAPWGFAGAGRLGAADGRGVAVVAVGRAGAVAGLFGVDPADVFAAGRAGGATAFTDG